MPYHQARLLRIQAEIEKLKNDRKRPAPNPFRSMSDEELQACFGDFPTGGDFFPPDFTDNQALQFYALSLEGFTREEAIARVLR